MATEKNAACYTSKKFIEGIEVQRHRFGCHNDECR